MRFRYTFNLSIKNMLFLTVLFYIVIYLIHKVYYVYINKTCLGFNKIFNFKEIGKQKLHHRNLISSSWDSYEEVIDYQNDNEQDNDHVEFKMETSSSVVYMHNDSSMDFISITKTNKEIDANNKRIKDANNKRREENKPKQGLKK